MKIRSRRMFEKFTEEKNVLMNAIIFATRQRVR